MNKIVKEIACQAHTHAKQHIEECQAYGYHMDHDEKTIQFERKFAELLIDRCCDVIVHGGYWNTFDGRKRPGTPQEIAAMIKDVFTK